MFGFDVMTAAGLLILAGNTVQCAVPRAPQITVTPLSAPVQYEFSLSAEELGRFKTDTISPYAPGVDTSTGGLRHDRPEVRTEVRWGVMNYEDLKISCLWYENINVTIDLSPKIYVASDNSNSPACRDAIINHELKHVSVDREIINSYAQSIGVAVKQAVDGIGAMGPYNYHELEEVRNRLIGHIEAAVESRKFLLYQEMSRRQAAVDSLEEYEYVSKICEEAKK